VTNRTLMELEWSRYRDALPGLKGGRLSRLVLYGALITAVTFGLLSIRTEVSFTHTAALAVMLCFVTMTFLLFMLESMRLADSNQQWWLLLPYDRFTLTLTKFRGYCGLGYVVLMIMALFTMAGYGLSAARLGSAGDSPSLAVLLAIAGIGITGVPVMAAWGIFHSVLFRSRWYWVIVYVLYLLLSFGLGPVLLGLVMVMEPEDSSRLLSLNWLTGIQLGMVIVGWPLAYGILKLAARYGMANLADPRNIPNAARRADPKAAARQVRGRHAATKRKPPAGAFQALCELERRRIGLIANHAASRITWLICVIVLMIGGYYAYGSSAVILSAPLTVCGIVTYLIVLYLPITVGQDLHGRKLDWWLTLPQPRWKLLIAKTYVYFRIALVITLSMFGALWLGLLARVAWDDAATLQGIAMDASWLAYVLLLGCLLFILALSYFVGSTVVNHAFPKSSLPVGLLIFIPILFREQITHYYLAELNRLSEVAPYWDRLLWTGLLAIIVSAFFLGLGAKYLNSLAKASPKQGNWLFGSQKRTL